MNHQHIFSYIDLSLNVAVSTRNNTAKTNYSLFCPPRTAQKPPSFSLQCLIISGLRASSENLKEIQQGNTSFGGFWEYLAMLQNVMAGKKIVFLRYSFSLLKEIWVSGGKKGPQSVSLITTKYHVILHHGHYWPKGSPGDKGTNADTLDDFITQRDLQKQKNKKRKNSEEVNTQISSATPRAGNSCHQIPHDQNR